MAANVFRKKIPKGIWKTYEFGTRHGTEVTIVGGITIGCAMMSLSWWFRHTSSCPDHGSMRGKNLGYYPKKEFRVVSSTGGQARAEGHNGPDPRDFFMYRAWKAEQEQDSN